MCEGLDKENYSVNINEIEQKINIFYGMILAHGTKKEKEDANIIIDWINFLEKNIGIKRCPVCNKKFTAKRKNQIYCSKDCNIKNYWERLSKKEKKSIRRSGTIMLKSIKNKSRNIKRIIEKSKTSK